MGRGARELCLSLSVHLARDPSTAGRFLIRNYILCVFAVRCLWSDVSYVMSLLSGRQIGSGSELPSWNEIN